MSLIELLHFALYKDFSKVSFTPLPAPPPPPHCTYISMYNAARKKEKTNGRPSHSGLILNCYMSGKYRYIPAM